jgi:hypothetical protein
MEAVSVTEKSRFTRRREALKIIGGSTALLPLAALTGCGGGDAPSAPAPAPEPAAATPPAESAAEAPAPAAETEPAGPSRITERDPQAQSLGYRHDATTVDATAYERYEAGQACSNCLLFQGAEGDEWGLCSIFPGREVKATGWCNVYAPKG